MSLISVTAVDQLINYDQLRALVVDDFPGMRSALKLTLSNFGITRIDLSSSASEALFRVQNSQYDVILCDYNLGEGRDGQQLLEEMRHRGLIQLKTVFIMVTAESVYEKVVATAELAPDDYMIKPFSGEVMRNRLENILRRKRAFERTYRHFEDHHLEHAITACEELVREKPKYAVDALRFKGECLNALGRFDEAEALYKQIIAMRAIPWARLGLARALHHLKKNAEADELLRDILDETPEMVAAYDLMADVRLAQKDIAGAQAALQAGVGISSHTVRRQQKLGNLALDNGDLDTAQTAFSAVIDKGRHSAFVTPNDYGHLCRVQVEQGQINAALDTLKKGKHALQTNPEGRLVSAVVQSLVHTRSGKPDEAAKALDEAARLRQEGARMDGPLMLELANTCLAHGRHDEADQLVAEVARNAHDSETLLAKAKQLYDDAGRGHEAQKLLSEATADVRNLNNEGVLLAHKKDFGPAVERMLEACHLAPYNPRVLMNGIWVILKSLEQGGMDEDRLGKARHYLTQVEKLSPGHTRLAGLRNHLKDIESRFGIRRRTGS